jgi:hypothetical protein
MGIPTSAADGTHIKDDFLGNTSVADGALGTVGWEVVVIGNASVLTYVASQNGVLRLTTDDTADADGGMISTHPDGIVLAGTNQLFRGRFRYPTITGNVLAANNFHFGFGDGTSVADHAVGVWVHSDAGVLSLEGASTNGDISQAVAGVPTLTSGTTMVIDTWHDLEVQMEGTNANGGPATLKLFVDGELAATIDRFLLGSTETMEFGLKHWQDKGSGDDFELDVDYIEAWLPRN